MSTFRRFFLVGIVFFLTTGWGSVGHRLINGNVAVQLPGSMMGFIQHSQFLADHASDADNRKNSDPTEGPKHFMDIDDYVEFPSHTVPKDLNALMAEYGSSRVTTNGINPWATVWTVDSLTAQMRRGDWTKVWQSAADLGHYVGDAHQPLHNTNDYDGRTSITGSKGIHSRYESGMISAYLSALTVHPDSIHYVSNPIEFVFGTIYQSNSYVDSIYLADIYARQVSGYSGSGSIPASYYAALWAKCKDFTQLEIQRATVDYASLLYTAWVNAGSPVVTSVSHLASSDLTPRSVVLGQNFPNPFNPSTAISFQVQNRAHVKLGVYSLHGQQIAVLMDRDLSAGSYHSNFDAGSYSLSSGLYLYRLEVQEPGQRYTLTNKMMFLK